MCNHNCNQGRSCPGECETAVDEFEGVEFEEPEFDMVDYIVIGSTVAALIGLFVFLWI